MKLEQYIETLTKVIDKYYSIICLLIVLILYLPYLNIISWGDDYAGYILQSQAMFNNSSEEFIEKQKFLFSLSENPKFPIYTPIGMPLLIGFTSFLTNHDPYLIKLLIPIFLFLISLILKNHNTNLLTILLLFHPTITDQFKDILGEIPAVLFLLLGVKSKNLLLKNLFFTLSCLIRPTFIIFTVIYLIFSSKKRIKDFSILLLYLLMSQLISQKLFGMNFYGYYITNKVSDSNSGIIEIFISNIFDLNLDRFIFFLEEIGLMLLGFSNPLNSLLGLTSLCFLLLYRNKYSFMILSFIIFHLTWGADYFVRYIYPVMFLFPLLLSSQIILKKFNKKLFLIFLIIFPIFFLQQIYSISKIDNQNGPHQQTSLELFAYVKNDIYGEIYNFHSPRTFRLFTQKDAYLFDKEFLPKSSLICIKTKECLIPVSYKNVFENEIYSIFREN